MRVSWRAATVALPAMAMAAASLLATAAPAAATIDQGTCTATGTATQSPGADLTKDSSWTVVMADQISGSWQGPAQTHVLIGARVFGLNIPIITRTGSSKTSGSAGPYNVADYAKYGRVIPLWGSSDSCHGYLTLIISDANPLLNAISIVALVLLVVGLLILLALARSRGGVGGRIFGAIVGLIAGAGAGVVLIELSILTPDSYVGLAAPIVGVLVGLLLPGTLYRVPAPPTAPLV